MHISSLVITLLSLSLVTAHSPPYHRHLGKAPLGKRHELVRRAGGAISNDTIDAMPADEAYSLTHGAAVPTSSAADASASEAAESGQAGDTVTPSSAVQSTSSPVQPTTSPTTSAAATPSVVAQSSTDQDTVEEVASSTSEEPIVETSSSTTPINAAPVTLSSVAPTTVSTRVVSASNRASVVTEIRTASGSSTASVAASNNDTEEKSGGLSKTALIGIIVAASVVGLGAIIVFVIRKAKLRKSGRFDDRMKPIDFSPHNDGMGNDDFLEKTLQRTASNASADRQRQQFVKELEDPNYVAGVPEHDFTAGAAQNHAGYGAYDDSYHADPFARTEAYEYDQDAYYQNDPHAYPPASQHVDYPQAQHADYPTQDQPAEGYANLQRGTSNGSDHARSAGGHGSPQYADFPSPDNYLGRPTGGLDGPYAQAAQYRAY